MSVDLPRGEGIEGDLRPGLEAVSIRKQRGERRKAAFDQFTFPRRYGRGCHLEHVHDPEVHPADGVGVVVDQADTAGGPGSLDGDLFGQLPPHAGVVGGIVAMLTIGAGDVATNPE